LHLHTIEQQMLSNRANNKVYTTTPRHSNPPLGDPDLAYNILKPHQQFCEVPTVIKRPYDPKNYTRIACISDTHGQHRQVFIPQCDILLHGGDFTQTGEHRLVKDVDKYFDQLLLGKDTRKRGKENAPPLSLQSHNEQAEDSIDSPLQFSSYNGSVGEIIAIAGNHDLTFDPETYANSWKIFHPINGPLDATITKGLLTHCTYLQDESYVSNGVKFWGSPWSPEFGYGWAFNQTRHEIHHKWDLIPSDTDVLITHGPPIGRGDLVHNGQRAGCVNLLQQVQTRIKPRIHLFGHIHEDYGVSSDGTTLFVNGSSCSLMYSPDNPCIIIDLPHDKTLPAVVVKPRCTLLGDEVVALLKSMCNHRVEYANLVPYFEGAKPMLEGEDLVVDDVLISDIGCRLGMHREKKWFELKKMLREFIMILRTMSY